LDLAKLKVLSATHMPDSSLGLIINEYRMRCRVPGISIAITRRGTLVHAEGYGFANIEHQAPATTETVYQSASLGKQFTAALVLLLVEHGMLGLDEPVAPYFCAASEEWSCITVRQLLSHTSGISDKGFGELNLRLDYTDEELACVIASTPLEFQPGTVWSYSNSGYILLGLLIARITGRFYGDLLDEWIFSPLGMTTARVISEGDIIPNRAAGYRMEGGVIRNQEYVSPSLNRTADGGLYFTVLDLAKWDRALYQGTIVSEKSREAMWTPVKLVDGSTAFYGLGWSVASSPQGRVVEHDGEWQGFSSHIVRYVDRGVGIMVLANLADAPVSDIARALVEVVGL
jgi:CubicO group peptidase (beta-lactamase class C family)